MTGDTTTTTTNCTNGEKRCSGQKAQQCQGGHFVDLFSCPADEVCENGACKTGTNPGDVAGHETTGGDTTPDTSPTCSCVGHQCGDDGCNGTCGTCTGNTHCENFQCVPGTTTCTPQCVGKHCGPDGCGGQCGGCQTGETCQSGQCVGGQDCNCNGAVCGLDNCGNTCGFCPGSASCESGRCVANTGGDSCQQILDCITSPTGCGNITDATAFDTCANACFDGGSATGQSEFNDYVGCLNTCPQNDDGTCALQNCLDVEAACHFDGTGFGQCVDIQDCLQGCADGDNGCVFGCYESGTATAQVAFLGLVECMNIECGPNNPSPDPNCNSTTTLPAACMTYLNQCQ